MRADRIFAYGATAGLIGDLLLGDPRRGHPVAGFGRAAAGVERRLWHDHRGWGALHTLVCAGGAAGAAALAARALRRRPAASVALTAAATWSVLGGTSLGREARSIGDALAAGDIDLARERLPRLCGRDPQSLDGPQIARAVVESVAENTSDAVVGALVWGALGGVPGLVGFRAANTLDAMVGHRSPRYLRYGWASARLDDLAGWPGARLTALLAVTAGGRPRGAVRAWRADAAKHPSPNAGPVEASFAGALGVRLGGTLAYAGRVEHRPVLNGETGRAVETGDIERAVRLSRRIGALALAVSVAARLAAAAAAQRIAVRGITEPPATGTRAGAARTARPRTARPPAARPRTAGSRISGRRPT
ncbi:cobalamin biosynthesis protein [Streptomyces sp. RKAG290]|uniref:cobalamin biosynthesis protein n=1 Tax=Streptomyces sp. RKAG290 TaxID=2888348 RepID=UPI00203365BE|nr:cobalamin biosynthesis protein [Streptomyces sp. RKAG290]MCM2414889.1 cobalamin biosynthesis protein [Streptomyces sp. RKAG290]